MDTRYKVLVVDDDDDLVRVLSERLEYEGFEALDAHEGVRAIERAHKDKPDLIILDLRMPAGSGQTVLQCLRGRADTKNIPIIVLTALSGPNLEGEMKAAGADDFVQKPCEMVVLLQKIRSLLKVKSFLH